MAEEKYIELYKKYTPKTWKGLIGQEKIANSLKAAIKDKKIPVAYGFFGPRGCGKTSAAKLLSKALNCLEPPLPGEACNKCSVCENINNNAQLGVNYISMANQGAAGDVRKIVDQARLAQPVNKPIFILDEVHNLSSAAWDALLIPLESSKMQTLFILCSTEAHKIPATILSRIQARSFSLVPPEKMATYLHKIIEKEGLEVSEDTINAAVREGRGSVRDSLTKLEGILQTGETPKSYGDRLLDSIEKKKLSDALVISAEFQADGGKPKHLAEQLFEDLRDILLLSIGADSEVVPGSPIENPKKFVLNLGGTPGALAIIEEIGDAITSMSVGSADHRILFEMALLKGINKVKKASAVRGK